MASLTVTYRTEQDRERATKDYIFPDYVSQDIKEQVYQRRVLHAWVIFTPPRARKWARENQSYPVRYVFVSEPG